MIRSAADTYFIISLVNKHGLKQQVFTKDLQLQICTLFHPVPLNHPKVALERPTLEKHVLFSQHTQSLAFSDLAEYDLIYQKKKKEKRKKDGSFSDVYTFPCEN